MDNDLIQDTNLDLLQVQVADVEYSGIAPINVDNQEHTISLEPSALSSKLDTSAFDEWTATHSAGQEYSAGEGIDITDHVISVTGQLTGDYLTKASADTLYQPIGDYLTTADSGNFYPMEGNPSGFLTGVDLTDYYKKNETSSKEEIANALTAIDNTISGLTGEFQEKGDYYSASNPSGFITGVDLSNYYEKNETSSKQEIGDVITEINNNITNLSGKYYPLNSNPSGYLTAHQDITDKLDVTAFTAYTATAQGTEYSAGDNINITNHVISGKDWSSEIASATTGKLDTSAFNSGDFYPMTGNPSGFLTGVDLSEYQKIEDMSSYQPVGDYYSASNPSGFITGVDLTPYQEKTGMTAYQPVGDYYSASNPSGFITGVDLSDYYKKNETSSKEEISAALTGKLDESAFTAYTATAVQGIEYTGISPIDVNNTTHEISADVWTLSGASGIEILEDAENKVTTLRVSSLNNYYAKNETSSKEEISAALSTAGQQLTPVDPVYIDTANNIGVYQTVLSAGNGIGIYQGPTSQPVCVVAVTGDYLSIDDASAFTGAYLPLSALNAGVGYDAHTSAIGLAQGSKVSARDGSFAQGSQVSALHIASVQGLSATAYDCAMSQGYEVSARQCAFAQGAQTTADFCSLAQGGHCSAWSASIAQGEYNTASLYSQAFGDHVIAHDHTMAIGAYNKTSANTPFVIGNGTNEANRSDLFIINSTGGVSALGKISANGVELGAGGDTIDLSAGEGISIVETADKVVISCTAAGGVGFPITGMDGSTVYSADCNGSSFNIRSQYSTTYFAPRSLYHAHSPAYGASAEYSDIIDVANTFCTAIPCVTVANSGLATANGILYIVTGN